MVARADQPYSTEEVPCLPELGPFSVRTGRLGDIGEAPQVYTGASLAPGVAHKLFHGMGAPGMLRRPFLLSRSRGASILYRATRNVSSAPPLIRIQNGTFYRNYPSEESQELNPPLFPNFNFVLPSKPDVAQGSEKKELQHWAVIGSTGRTALLDILRGQYISIPPNARSYPYLSTDEIAAKEPRLRYPGNAIQYVGFSGEGSQATGGTRGAYLSARYESLREDTDWTVRQYLKGQTSLNPLEGEEESKIHDEAFLGEVVASLKLEELLDMPVANLSNGQTRRARIAKALLSKPELLLLDEPFSKSSIWVDFERQADLYRQWDLTRPLSIAYPRFCEALRKSPRQGLCSPFALRTSCRTGSLI